MKSCCVILWNIVLSLAVASSLIIGIYDMIKVNENSPESIECDMCKKMLNIGDICDKICNNEEIEGNVIQMYFENL